MYGDFWFWPGWNQDAFDYVLYYVPTGITCVEVIPLLTWPDTGNDSINDLWFYGAMLNETMTDILGDWDAVNWGFGP